ncbi:LysR family transcriptional regulator [Saccharobesus litoralis]|uniref:LysR family transcriptional regulator n=1 Tax=Saccharobesus litoralis TaxID=2172099 RepID=A0A2S0VL59_9ALTE|nr:LysR substrate-binding domain-containing protein [Saccharobesus litoralis]AWB64937.1 LysR family transcriptional regulator [Saccharobesus litoralis]
MYNSAITLEALIVLDAIDNRGSFAAAAEQLNKVPSALSYIVQKLEEQLAVTLFVRQGRRSVLTPAGRHLLDEGRKVLAAVSKISEQTQTISHGWEPKLRIGIDSILDISQVLPAIQQFLQAHPNIEIDISEEVLNGAWEALIEDRVDIMLGAPAPIPNHQGLRAEPFCQVNNVLVAATNHPINHLSQPISRYDIQQFRTIIVHDSAKRIIARSANIIEQSHHFYVQTVEQKLQAIIAGIGIGFLPESRITKQLERGELVVIDIEQPVNPVDLYMAWKLVNKGKALQSFRQCLAAR